MRTKHGVVLFAVLSLLVTGFIFSNSLQESEDSHAKSDMIVETVKPVVEPLFPPDNTEEETHKTLSFLVRKAAHFVEFAALGICAGGFFSCLARCRNRRYRGMALLFCLAVACCDETIQSFLDRTNSLKDVALDVVGSFCGILLLMFAFRMLEKRGGNPCPN